ncbi:MAG TPA: NAD(P)-dependent oxidoreductase [Puia sp.]|nr:NAD(P)-dependent oxidoreductase [Puia sp.]
MGNKRIGWIGLGNMGTPMVKNLVRGGFGVTVYNRTAAKAAPLAEAGAKVAASAAALWEVADILITMVADDAALQAIYAGGLLAGARAGKMVIDMSTVSPATSRELAGELAAKGVDYLDAPVAGSVKPAEMGQLVIMVGGKKETYESALPIFAKLGKASFLMGGHGAGNAAKLAINTLLAFNMQGLAEAVLFAAEKGIRPESLLAVIGESAVANGVTKMKTANIVEDNYGAAFALKHLAKDLRLALGQGMHTPGAIAVHDSFQQALSAGWGEKDMAAIYPYLAGKKLESRNV